MVWLTAPVNPEPPLSTLLFALKTDSEVGSRAQKVAFFPPKYNRGLTHDITFPCIIHFAGPLGYHRYNSALVLRVQLV